jgi:hypothetical protein
MLFNLCEIYLSEIGNFPNFSIIFEKIFKKKTSLLNKLNQF